MATILVLKPTNSTRPSRPVEARGSAEIIFFPGVRYERWASAPATPAKAKRKRRARVKRDRLTIVV